MLWIRYAQLITTKRREDPFRSLSATTLPHNLLGLFMLQTNGDVTIPTRQDVEQRREDVLAYVHNNVFLASLVLTDVGQILLKDSDAPVSLKDTHSTSGLPKHPKNFIWTQI